MILTGHSLRWKMSDQRPGGGKKGFEKRAVPEFGAGNSNRMFLGNASHLKNGVCLALPPKDVLLRVRGHLFTSGMPAVSTAPSSGGPQFQNNPYSTGQPALLPICTRAKGRQAGVAWKEALLGWPSSLPVAAVRGPQTPECSEHWTAPPGGRTSLGPGAQQRQRPPVSHGC